jgi:hypothetical protein
LGNAYTSAAFSANGGYRIALPAAFIQIQAKMVSYVSGSASVVINASTGTANTEAIQLNAANLNMTDAADGPVSPGTAATKSQLAGMVYNTTAPAPTNGQQLSLQSDSLGNLETVLPDLIVTGQSAQTATVNNILTTTSGTAATNAINYKSAMVQVVSTGTGGTFIFEGSNDNVSFVAIPVYNQLILTGTPITAAITATASQIGYVFPIQFQYIRLRIATTITGGSIQAFSRLTQASWAPSITQVANATAANLNATVTGTITAVTTTTTNNTTYTATDQASAAITTTTTGAAKTIPAGTALSMMIAVTAVSGTTPTYDFQLQESVDNVNWVTIYQAPRITATGFYQIPAIKINALNYRYVETIGGTTPSFTRTLTSNRIAESSPLYRNIIDRTINPTSTNSTTSSLFVEGATSYEMIVNQGTGGSAVTFALDGSDDNVNWVQGIAVVSGVLGGSTPVSCSYGNGSFRYIRGRVITGVASATISYVTLIGSSVGLAAQPKGTAQAPVYNAYGTTNITTSAYTQLVASTAASVSLVDIFDSSGQAMILAVGPSGQEVIQAYIAPGGEQLPVSIPAGARIAYKALTANATTGYLTMNLLT